MSIGWAEMSCRLGGDVLPTGRRCPADWAEMSRPLGGDVSSTGQGTRAYRGPVRWPDGHASRLGQIGVDSPDPVHDLEYRFWCDATEWDTRPTKRAEFTGRSYPPDGSIDLLYQRLGSDDPGDTTRAHLDRATDDMPAEVARPVGLGANTIGPGSGWCPLRDPAGLPFCVTCRSPY
jgi:hypothetical protein